MTRMFDFSEGEIRGLHNRLYEERLLSKRQLMIVWYSIPASKRALAENVITSGADISKKFGAQPEITQMAKFFERLIIENISPPLSWTRQMIAYSEL